MFSRFKVGDSVPVKDLQALSHIRTPFFLRGKYGVVVSIRGSFDNPEQLAYGRRDLARVNPYCVEFDLAHVWDDRPVPAGKSLSGGSETPGGHQGPE